MHGRSVNFGNTNRQSEDELSSCVINDRAREIAQRVERQEMAQGYKLQQARERVAGRIGVRPGMLARLAAGRLKTIPAGFIARLHADIVRRLQQELARAEHEYHLALQIGLRADSPEMARLESSVAKAQALIDEVKG